MVHNVYQCKSCGAYCDSGHDHDILDCQYNQERNAAKNMGDAVTREDAATNAPALSASPATSCKSCEDNNWKKAYEQERFISDHNLKGREELRAKCEKLMKALEWYAVPCISENPTWPLKMLCDVHKVAEQALSEHRKNMGEG